MSWETRRLHGAHRYYYRVVRNTEGRLTKRYYGRGPRAVRAAAEDTERQAMRDKKRMDQKVWETLDSQVASLGTLMALLSHSTLVDSGWYQHHRGEWRKRRTNGRYSTNLS